MPRRVSLPGAAELFRTTPAQSRTGHQDSRPKAPEPPADEPADVDTVGDTTEPDSAAAETDIAEPAPQPKAAARTPKRRSGSGRVRHDEKITVYVSNDELLELERARLSLRAEHRMGVDRGRIVRAALAMALGDLAERGSDSELVRRLSQQ